MKREGKVKIFETDLYHPVCSMLKEKGYTVNSEVKGCDITAVKDDELIIVELKLSLNITLLVQAVQRQKLSELVYVAVLKPKRGIYSSEWRGYQTLLRRLGIGLILVSLGDDGFSYAEVAADPVPFDMMRSMYANKKKKHSLLREIGGRSGDYNVGGSCRRKLVTVYRENSIHIACCIRKYGPGSPADIKKLASVGKTPSILSKNFYGWFEKVSRGVYGLTPSGYEAMEQYPELVEHYSRRLDEKPAQIGEDKEQHKE